MLIGDYTNGGKTRSATLTVSLLANGQRSERATHAVTGKAEARKLCAALGAKPWNF